MSSVEFMSEKPKVVVVETVVDDKKEAAALADMTANLHLSASAQIGKIREFRYGQEDPMLQKGKWKISCYTIPETAEHLAAFLDERRATKDNEIVIYPLFNLTDDFVSWIEEQAYTDEHCLELVEDEVWQRLVDEGMAELQPDGTLELVFGGCATMWHIQKEIMLRDFARHWKSPEELYPDVLFD